MYQYSYRPISDRQNLLRKLGVQNSLELDNAQDRSRGRQADARFHRVKASILLLRNTMLLSRFLKSAK